MYKSQNCVIKRSTETPEWTSDLLDSIINRLQGHNALPHKQVSELHLNRLHFTSDLQQILFIWVRSIVKCRSSTKEGQK